MRFRSTIICFIIAGFVLVSRQSSMLGQQPTTLSPASPAQVGSPFVAPYAQPTRVNLNAISPEAAKQLQEFQQAVAALRSAKTDEDRATAKDELQALLLNQMERELKAHEVQLAEIEARAANLRQQIEERRSAKTEIAKVMLMMIENPGMELLPASWTQSLAPPATQIRGYAYPNINGQLRPAYAPSISSQPAIPYPTQPAPASPPLAKQGSEE